MADIDGDLSIGGTIDIDRVVIDPDYRRLVIALLRQAQSPGEKSPLAVPGTGASRGQD